VLRTPPLCLVFLCWCCGDVYHVGTFVCDTKRGSWWERLEREHRTSKYAVYGAGMDLISRKKSDLDDILEGLNIYVCDCAWACHDDAPCVQFLHPCDPCVCVHICASIWSLCRVPTPFGSAQVNNPMVVMDQETTKKFLFSKPAEKYNVSRALHVFLSQWTGRDPGWRVRLRLSILAFAGGRFLP
jgi:hypothetical protein